MPYTVRKIKNQNLYSVKNAITGQIHSHHTSRANAKKQVKLLQAINHGFIPNKVAGGLIDYRYPINVSKSLIYGREKQLNPTSLKTLEKYGDIPIVQCTLFRYLIPAPVIQAVKLLFSGHPPPPLDKLAHLGIIFTLQTGKKIMCEKNENINITDKLFHFPSDTQYLHVSLNGQDKLTLDEIVKKTRAKMGLTFSKYTALHYNCQNFVLNILQVNHIGNKIDEEFVKQNLSDLIKKAHQYPFLEQVVNSITDLGYAADVIRQGAGRVHFLR